MKILFITPTVSNFGGVPKICLSRANYCARVFGDEVHFISQNEAGKKPFFEVEASIVFHAIQLGKKNISFFSSYLRQVQKIVDAIEPDLILVFDNGLKAFLLPYFLKTKAIKVFECHSTLAIQEKSASVFFDAIFAPLFQLFKRISVKRYDLFLALSQASIREWKIKKDYAIVPNFVENTSGKISALTEKKVLAVARNSYEKGLDQLLHIWQEVSLQNLDWTLQLITTQHEGFFDVQRIIAEKKINNVAIIPPQPNIEAYYASASVYLMTSRYEGFPLVLLEAMSFGLPVIAYNCPIGPKEIIVHNENGILVENGNQNDYVLKLNSLLKDFKQRERLQQNALQTASQYSLEKMMKAFTSQVRALHFQKR